MYKRVLETIHTHNLFHDGATIIVGVSGGADSMALLHILQRLSVKHNYTIIIAHVHYGIRGDAARTDRDRVVATADAFGNTVFIKDLTKKSHPTDEAWMRATRYTFFETLQRKHGADYIATGHTMNDRVETLLHHLIRGSGLAGLAGIHYKRGIIVRPLLDCTRTAVENYCTKHTISFGVDATNADTTYLRNRIRHDLIPLLRKNYNPQIITTLARTAQSIADDYALLTDWSAHHSIPHQRTHTSITFDATTFCALAPALQRHTLRNFAKTLAQTTPSFGMIEHWRRLIASTKNKTQKMETDTLIITKNGATVSMTVRTPS